MANSDKDVRIGNLCLSTSQQRTLKVTMSNNVTLQVFKKGNRILCRIQAPKDVQILREELINDENNLDKNDD
jgi:sRNA-binding carbon storage regulator CsrA